ncbi:MAG: adenosine deaminase [Chloroflexi bacterium]|nr:adenosine deaminase [Chloroflexota bacterium]
MLVPADLATLPKAEIHVHLEGAVRPATLEEFSAREGVRMSRGFTDLNSFIETYMMTTRVMIRPGDYTRVVREYAEGAARAGVRYAELEMTPALGPRTLESVFLEAAEAASQERDVVLRLVLGLGRMMPAEVMHQAFDATRDVPGLIALGLGGPEQGFPAEPFAEVFAEAKRRGLRSAPHAGENAGPESIREALDALQADRIQHGVRAVEDPALVAELAERRIPLAVCPTSNVRLGVVRSLEEHPLRRLWDAGVSVSVNTDDPGFFDCDLLGEYAIAGRLLDLDRAGYAQLARNSVDGSFAPEEMKGDLRAAIADWENDGAEIEA